MNFRAQRKIFEKSWPVFKNQGSKPYNADGAKEESSAVISTVV